MKFTNFMSGCIGKVLMIIGCIILGMVLSVGGVALAGYIVVSREGMVGTLQEKATENNLPINFSEEYLEMSLLQWGTEAFSALGSVNTMTLGQLQGIIGYSGITAMITEAIGIDEEPLKAATLGTLGETISTNLTLKIATDKLKIELPEMPVFEDDGFLNRPLNEAFTAIEEFSLGDFVEITPESSVLLKNLADLKIGEMSDPEGGLDDRINGMKLNEVIEITDESTNVLKKLQDVTIGDLGKQSTSDKINGMLLCDLITIVDPAEPNGSSKFMWALRNAAITGRTAKYGVGDPIIDTDGNRVLDGEGKPAEYVAGVTVPDGAGGTKTSVAGEIVYDSLDNEVRILGIEDRIKITPLNKLLVTGSTHVWSYIGTATTENLGAKIDDMCVKDVLEITASSNAIMRKMRKYDATVDAPTDADKFGANDVKVSELGTEINTIVQDCTLGEIITIRTEDPNKSAAILISLKDKKVSELDDAMKNLVVRDVFSETQCESGVLSLVDCENTKLTEVPAALTNEVKGSKLERLRKAGIITSAMNISNVEVRSAVRNQTIDAMINQYMNMLNGTPAVPVRIYLPDTTELTPAYVASLPDFVEGCALVLSGDTVLDGNFEKVFSVMTNGHKLTIAEGTTFTSKDTDDIDVGGYCFFSNNAHNAVIISAYTEVAGGGTVEYAYTDGVTPNATITSANVDATFGSFAPMDIAAAAKITVEIFG